MSTVLGTDIEKMLSRAGRAWEWILGFGILTLALGVVVLIWPKDTLVVIGYLFASQLVVAGVFQFAAAFGIPGENGWLRALTAILAIFSFALGIYLFGHVGLSLLVLVFTLGFFWIFYGFVQLNIAIGHSELPARGWLGLSGVLGLAAGIIVIVWPGISLLALALVLGVYLVIYGAVIAASAIHMRSIMRSRRSPSMLAPAP